jgi:hypothetical protein
MVNTKSGGKLLRIVNSNKQGEGAVVGTVK